MPYMTLVGYTGFEEEGQSVYLYQCPLCKRVEYNTGESVCDCDTKKPTSRPCCMRLAAELAEDHILVDEGGWFLPCRNPITFCPFCGKRLDTRGH